jgi:hypothetical protein
MTDSMHAMYIASCTWTTCMMHCSRPMRYRSDYVGGLHVNSENAVNFINGGVFGFQWLTRHYI